MISGKTLPLGVTARFLMNDFVGQKFLEFILGQGVEMNLCQKKPGGHSVLQKAVSESEKFLAFNH